MKQNDIEETRLKIKKLKKQEGKYTLFSSVFSLVSLFAITILVYIIVMRVQGKKVFFDKAVWDVVVGIVGIIPGGISASIAGLLNDKIKEIEEEKYFLEESIRK